MIPLEISLIEVDEWDAKKEIYHLKVPWSKEGIELGVKFLDLIVVNQHEKELK